MPNWSGPAPTDPSGAWRREADKWPAASGSHGRQPPKSAFLVEGAIDALSAWTLDERARIDIVISTTGATGKMPEWIDGFQLETVFCGYDADQAGDLAATMLQAKNPAVRRMRPGGDGDVGDWNDILTGRKNNHEPAPGQDQ